MDAVDQEWLESIERITNQQEFTSKLLPYVVNDFRTYVCKLRAICYDVEGSSYADEEDYILIIGCYTHEDPRRYVEPIEECKAFELQTISEREILCREQIKQKVEIGTVFLKAAMHRDAYHKKTGLLVYKYQSILKRLHEEMYEHVRLMSGYFTEFIDRTKCYLQQCDRAPGMEMDMF